jgi:hypothetical protein
VSRYSVHPLDAKFYEWDVEQKAKRTQYWAALYEMRQEYTQEYDIFDTAKPRMDYWAEQKYGFQMGSDGEGHYTNEYTVTDPKKFMLFQIKYMK